ncbi:hypothetical protein [Aminobacterium mobile]
MSRRLLRALSETMSAVWSRHNMPSDVDGAEFRLRRSSEIEISLTISAHKGDAETIFSQPR